ncbi:AraC family transcriptional regulator [Paenibacillus sanguinis]|uniref:AraC family transcriptional regulator n=1 Tax=Paenibacillus sanguinis TaxID=225906 RepID=UPI00036321EF|nr:AraC family transcriptional regulator [Paenibacillus sanguinis]
MNQITEEAQVRTETLQQLTRLLYRHAPAAGTYQTAIPSLSLMRAIQPSTPFESVYKPSVCIVAQGAKLSTLAGQPYRYDSSAYFLTSVQLPVASSIVEASPSVPYLGLKLCFEPEVIVEIAGQAASLRTAHEEASRTESHPGLSVQQISSALLDAAVRLVGLLDTPGDIPVLGPLIIREILYRIVQDQPSGSLEQLGVSGSQAYNIAQAIDIINREYDHMLTVQQLAKSVNMSVSAFHKHFKQVTTLSPLQYQKSVRLHEARRIMLAEGTQVADAAFRVGYESPSQFSREYARLFGKPPMVDVQQLRESLRAANGSTP